MISRKSYSFSSKTERFRHDCCRCRLEKVDREKSRHRRYCACAAPLLLPSTVIQTLTLNLEGGAAHAQ